MVDVPNASTASGMVLNPSLEGGVVPLGCCWSCIWGAMASCAVWFYDPIDWCSCSSCVFTDRRNLSFSFFPYTPRLKIPRNSSSYGVPAIIKQVGKSERYSVLRAWEYFSEMSGRSIVRMRSLEAGKWLNSRTAIELQKYPMGQRSDLCARIKVKN